MLVRDIMTRDLTTLQETEFLLDATLIFSRASCRHVPILRGKQLVGIVTERDIVRKCFKRIDACANFQVKDVMSKEVAVGIPDDDLEYAISAMKQKRIRHLPIVDNRRVVGMVSMRDLLDVELKECQIEVRYAGLVMRRPPRRVV